MKIKLRLPELDDLRGISIIVMILIHTNAYFLSNKWAYATAEISQFAVVAFLFCSSYLTLLKPYPTTAEIIPYMVKRLKRLLPPFFLFFAFYVLFGTYGLGKHFTSSYIIKSLLFTGGIDYNWMVLLFVQMMIVTPFIQFLYQKSKVGLYIYTFVALLSTIIFLKYTPLSYYRWIMWLPWSLVIVYTLYFDKIWNNILRFVWVTLLLEMLFFVTQQGVLLPLNHSFSMYSNKYPPNLYHIVYSLFAVNIIYFFSRQKFFSSPLIQSVVHFFSVNSYSLFFIHIIVIEGVWKWIRPSNWILFFLIVAYISTLIQIVFNKIGERMKPAEHK